MGRAKEKELGTLQYINPQEEKEFQLEIGVLEGDEIREHENMIKTIVKEKPKITSNAKEFLKIVEGTHNC
jgi:hypothetical protein